MEEEIQILFNTLRLIGADLDQLQKQYKVPIQAQMFVKSNPKGMALLLHTLLCYFDADNTTRFNVCWFPYTMIELKDFKQLALDIITELTSQGRIQSGIITKAVLESASGVKMWQSLRTLSDYCLLDQMNKGFSKGDMKNLPQFVQSVLQARAEQGEDNRENFNPNQSQMSTVSQQQQHGINLEINAQNANSQVLKRNIRSSNVHIHQQMTEFTEKARNYNSQQQSWVEFSTQLNEDYLKAKADNSSLKKQAQKLGLMSEDGFTKSELAKDLQIQGISCIDNVPQIQEIRDMHQKLVESNILESNNLSHNITTITNPLEATNQSLCQKTLFANISTNDEKDILREQLKFSYSKDVFSLNMLLDKSLDQIISLNNGIELNGSRRYQTHNQTREQVDWLIESHSRNIERIKETLKFYNVQ